MLFQTCMSLFLLVNTKKVILKNVDNQTVVYSGTLTIVGKITLFISYYVSERRLSTV